jgi:hypothetical protein
VDELIAIIGLGLGASLGLSLVRGIVRAFEGGPTPTRGSRASSAYRYSTGGQTWYLHARSPAAPGRRKLRVFYFAREQRPAESVPELPPGFEVMLNPRTGMPLLKRRLEPAGGPRRAARD